MKQYIERESAIGAIDKALKKVFVLPVGKSIIDRVPAADVREVVRGKWEDVEVTYVADKTTLPFERISSMRCNQCNRYHTEIYYYGNPTEMAHFCPNCGAEMR